VDILQNIAAIHLMAICQALELRGIEQASPKAREAFALVRSRVAFMDADRRFDRDIAAVVELIRSGELSQALMS
jgi:histidine ammonia-lyase/phenylalanine ammonia-lyase